MKRIVVLAAVLSLLAAGCTAPSATPSPSQPASGSPTPGPTPIPTAAQAAGKISHVIIIMQENRSFDSYFGTYPGADGLPAAGGKFTVCVNDPATGTCVSPFHDAAEVNAGGPHGAVNATADIDGGKMDGFIKEAETRCTGSKPCKADEVVGYRVGTDIPNYWAYAKNFVLDERMFESVASWSFTSHLAMVSAWAANCPNPANPMSCTSDLMPRDLSLIHN